MKEPRSIEPTTTKNYYAILGVAPDATPSGIRAAYRDAVQRTHPDHAGPEAAPDFRDVIEAHSVLSDPDRRQQYNETLSRYAQERTSPSIARSAPGRMREPDRVPGLAVEIILTAEEAERGGTLSVGIPVQEVCRTCEGTGWDWLFPCLSCGGAGAVSHMRPIQVPIPQALRFGLTPEVSLPPLGISNLLLKITIRVSGEQL